MVPIPKLLIKINYVENLGFAIHFYGLL